MFCRPRYMCTYIHSRPDRRHAHCRCLKSLFVRPCRYDGCVLVQILAIPSSTRSIAPRYASGSFRRYISALTDKTIKPNINLRSMVLRQVHDSTLAGDVLLIITNNWWENIPFRHGVLVTDVIPYLIKGLRQAMLETIF